MSSDSAPSDEPLQKSPAEAEQGEVSAAQPPAPPPPAAETSTNPDPSHPLDPHGASDKAEAPPAPAGPEPTPTPTPPGQAPAFVSPVAGRDYRVSLDVFSGPLDLLLYLIKRDEINIQDIPIAHITVEYVKFLDLMSEWNVNMAGEFLVMAATLMEIKSRMLLPDPPPLEEDEEEDGDPRLELVRQLMEYKRYKEAALNLADRADKRALRFSRPGERIEGEPQPVAVAGVEMWQLVEAFRRILEATGAEAFHHVRIDHTPQEVYMARLEARARKEGRLKFLDAFEGVRTRPALIGMFLALLELCRLFVVRAEQASPKDDIWLVFIPEDQRTIAVRPVKPDEETFVYAELDQPASDIWERDAVWKDDEIDAEIKSVAVKDFVEEPPAAVPEAAAPAAPAQAAQAGPRPPEAAASPSAEAPQAAAEGQTTPETRPADEERPPHEARAPMEPAWAASVVAEPPLDTVEPPAARQDDGFAAAAQAAEMAGAMDVAEDIEGVGAADPPGAIEPFDTAATPDLPGPSDMSNVSDTSDPSDVMSASLQAGEAPSAERAAPFDVADASRARDVEPPGPQTLDVTESPSATNLPDLADTSGASAADVEPPRSQARDVAPAEPQARDVDEAPHAPIAPGLPDLSDVSDTPDSSDSAPAPLAEPPDISASPKQLEDAALAAAASVAEDEGFDAGVDDTLKPEGPEAGRSEEDLDPASRGPAAGAGPWGARRDDNEARYYVDEPVQEESADTGGAPWRRMAVRYHWPGFLGFLACPLSGWRRVLDLDVPMITLPVMAG
ncbi:MAG TPA: segregation/condensation protein A, partial [Candidatus Brocadiia bacterium]|nr:segregation/condensation protein A [Candidatus Brocadiia bacterium]